MHNRYMYKQSKGCSGDHFKTTYDFLKSKNSNIFTSQLNTHLSMYGLAILCRTSFLIPHKIQKDALKFHTKYLTHTLKEGSFIQRWNFKNPSIQISCEFFKRSIRHNILLAICCIFGAYFPLHTRMCWGSPRMWALLFFAGAWWLYFACNLTVSLTACLTPQKPSTTLMVR